MIPLPGALSAPPGHPICRARLVRPVRLVRSIAPSRPIYGMRPNLPTPPILTICLLRRVRRVHPACAGRRPRPSLCTCPTCPRRLIHVKRRARHSPTAWPRMCAVCGRWRAICAICTGRGAMPCRLNTMRCARNRGRRWRRGGRGCRGRHFPTSCQSMRGARRLQR